MKTAAATALILLAVGCTSPGPHAASSTAAASVSSQLPASSSLPSSPPISSPMSDLPLSTVDFHCRLPVVISSDGDSAGFRGGFIMFPGATFVADPAGVIQFHQQELATAATPVLYGVPQAGKPFYDHAMGRWIPAGAGQTSPDGAFYAYPTLGASNSEQTRIHVVDVAHGTDRAFVVPTPVGGTTVGVQIGDFDGYYVYFLATQFEQLPSGVWRLDIASGSIRAMAQVTSVMIVRNGYAWVGRVDPRDPSPPTAARSGELYDSIVRVDLSTGAETPWYYAPGHDVLVRGLDYEGRPIVEGRSAPYIDHSGLLLIPAPGNAGTNIHDASISLSDPQADIGRLWFGNDRGLYLWTRTAGIRKVFTFNGHHQMGETMYPAGFCR